MIGCLFQALDLILQLNNLPLLHLQLGFKCTILVIIHLLKLIRLSHFELVVL